MSQRRFLPLLLMIVIATTGFSSCRKKLDGVYVNPAIKVVKDESIEGFVIDRYMLDNKCIASSWAPERAIIKTYVADIDSDDFAEFIAECTYADGAQRVIVYRENEGTIEVGELYHNAGVNYRKIIESYDQLSNQIQLTCDGKSWYTSFDKVIFKDFEG